MCCTHSCSSHTYKLDAAVYNKGIKSPSIKLGFNLVFHQCRQKNTFSPHNGPYLTSSMPDVSFSSRPLHCHCHVPSPISKLFSPSWITQKRQFWTQASGNDPCFITHLSLSVDSKCPSSKPGSWKCTHCISQLSTFLTAALPTFLPFCICFSHARDIG